MKTTFATDTPFGRFVLPLVYDEGTVGVSASGGADSTIVLFMLFYLGIEPRVLFLNNANSKFEALQRCVDWINKRFLHLKPLVIERVDRTSLEGSNIRSEIVALTNKVNYLYTGVTKNPPVEVSSTGIPNRPAKNTTTNIITPFLEFDKRVPIYLYRFFGAEELLSLTHTCTQQVDSICGMCFACKERQWAIENQGDNQ